MYRAPVARFLFSICILFSGAALLLTSCSPGSAPTSDDRSDDDHPLAHETPDDRPVFAFDHTVPFHLELGRGSGWHGLNTIAVNEKGDVTLCYLDNHFPKAIKDFAACLDKLLARNGLGQVKWANVPAGEERKHEEAIWESIRRRTEKP